MPEPNIFDVAETPKSSNIFDVAPAETPKETGAKSEWFDWNGVKAKNAVTPDTNKPTVQTEEGYLFYGPDQGNMGKPGFFNAQGQRVMPGLKSVLEREQKGLESAAAGIAFPAAPVASKIGQIVGPLAGRFAPAAGRIGAGTLGGAFMGSATAEPPQGADLTEQAKSRAEAALHGARVGAAFSTALEAASPIVGPVIGKAYNALAPQIQKARNWWKGTAQPEGPVTTNMEPAAAKVIQENIEPTPTQILAETAPQPKQTVAAQKAVGKTAEEFTTATQKTPFSGVAEVEAVAKNPQHPRYKDAKEVMDRINQMKQQDPDLAEIASTSQGLRAVQEQLKVDNLYARRDALAKGVKVDPSGTVSEIDKILGELTGPNASKWPNSDVAIDKLRQLRESLVNTSKEVPIGLYGPEGETLTRTVEKPNTFMAMRRTLSDIGDELSGYFKGANVEIGEKGANYIKRIKQALANDTSNAAQNSGNPALAQADKIANESYSKFAGTYRDPEIYKALNSKDFSTLLQSKINNGAGKFQQLYESLDPKGKAAVAESVVNDAFKKAYNSKTGVFDPGAVASGIQDNLDAMNISMSKNQVAQLEGLKKQMQLINRYNFNQMSPAELAALPATGPISYAFKLYQAIKSKGLDTIFGSNVGKELFFASKNLPPDGKLMGDLVKTHLPRLSALPDQESK